MGLQELYNAQQVLTAELSEKLEKTQVRLLHVRSSASYFSSFFP